MGKKKISESMVIDYPDLKSFILLIPPQCKRLQSFIYYRTTSFFFENLLLATFNETSVKEMKRHQRANFSVLSTFHAPNFSMCQDFLTNPIQEFKNL